MHQFDFTPQGVCPNNISFTLSDDGQTIESVAFSGGCNGNLKAIGKLVSGRSVTEVVNLLQGNTCGPRSTSCTDQLTRALTQAQELLAQRA